MAAEAGELMMLVDESEEGAPPASLSVGLLGRLTWLEAQLVSVESQVGGGECCCLVSGRRPQLTGQFGRVGLVLVDGFGLILSCVGGRFRTYFVLRWWAVASVGLVGRVKALLGQIVQIERQLMQPPTGELPTRDNKQDNLRGL
jgi:hypothetical protein